MLLDMRHEQGEDGLWYFRTYPYKDNHQERGSNMFDIQGRLVDSPFQTAEARDSETQTRLVQLRQQQQMARVDGAGEETDETDVAHVDASVPREPRINADEELAAQLYLSQTAITGSAPL